MKNEDILDDVRDMLNGVILVDIVMPERDNGSGLWHCDLEFASSGDRPGIKFEGPDSLSAFVQAVRYLDRFATGLVAQYKASDGWLDAEGFRDELLETMAASAQTPHPQT
jgi:hypothetical protein